MQVLATMAPGFSQKTKNVSILFNAQALSIQQGGSYRICCWERSVLRGSESPAEQQDTGSEGASWAASRAGGGEIKQTLIWTKCRVCVQDFSCDLVIPVLMAHDGIRLSKGLLHAAGCTLVCLLVITRLLTLLSQCFYIKSLLKG